MRKSSPKNQPPTAHGAQRDFQVKSPPLGVWRCVPRTDVHSFGDLTGDLEVREGGSSVHLWGNVDGDVRVPASTKSDLIEISGVVGGSVTIDSKANDVKIQRSGMVVGDLTTEHPVFVRQYGAQSDRYVDELNGLAKDIRGALPGYRNRAQSTITRGQCLTKDNLAGGVSPRRQASSTWKEVSAEKRITFGEIEGDLVIEGLVAGVHLSGNVRGSIWINADARAFVKVSGIVDGDLYVNGQTRNLTIEDSGMVVGDLVTLHPVRFRQFGAESSHYKRDLADFAARHNVELPSKKNPPMED